MSKESCDSRFTIWAAALLALNLGPVCAQPTNATYPLDLPTALQLAGAQNLDVQIARERLAEAQANRQSALEQFFPWISAGAAYHNCKNPAARAGLRVPCDRSWKQRQSPTAQQVPTGQHAHSPPD